MHEQLNAMRRALYTRMHNAEKRLDKVEASSSEGSSDELSLLQEELSSMKTKVNALSRDLSSLKKELKQLASSSE